MDKINPYLLCEAVLYGKNINYTLSCYNEVTFLFESNKSC